MDSSRMYKVEDCLCTCMEQNVYLNISLAGVTCINWFTLTRENGV